MKQSSIDLSVTGLPAHHLECSRQNSIDEQVSFNFSLAKVLCILIVVLGHWTESLLGLPLWIPVTLGLFVFAYSSGYFTALLYGEKVDQSSFWRKKLQRLGVRYWIVLAFIAVIVTLKGKSVLHWHSLLHMAGLSGLLNWLGISNKTALGAGLWFFTLLLLFYISYPYLALAARSRTRAAGMLVGGFVVAAYLQLHIKVGHELWLTAYAFIAGVACSMQRIRVSALFAGVVLGLSCGALLALNMFGFNGANTLLIGVGGLSCVFWLAAARLPHWPFLRHLASLEKYLLEIFLIHTYLFVRPSGNQLFDFAVSLSLIMLSSVIINRIADTLSNRKMQR